jgi:hypothetical protein
LGSVSRVVKRIRTAVVAALIVLPAPVAAGCAGDEPSEFRNGYEAAIKRLNRANAEIQRTAASRNQTNAQIAADFRRTANAFETTRDDLSGLDPPQDAADEFDQMLSVLGTSVRDLRAAGEAAKANDPAAFERAVEDMSKSSKELTDSERALRKATGS